MAAGVSIRVCLLLQLLGFTTVLTLGDTIHDIHEYVGVDENGLWSPQLQFRPWEGPNVVRVRRQVDTSTENTPTTTTTTPAPPPSVETDSPADKASSTTTVSPTTTTTLATTTTTTTTSATTTSTTTTTTAPGPQTTTPITTHIDVDHDYYKSTVYRSTDGYWLTKEIMDTEGKITHSTLSDSHRTAGTINLSFDFPFYGHDVRKATIATGGFVYMSEFVHQWLTATQYVAPLMANFDTKLGNNSFIHYRDNGSALTVWWEDIHIKDDKDHIIASPFSFQATLHADGRIVFVYKDIPVGIKELSTAKHPVKVGVSDAYYVDQRVRSDGGGSYTRRTIYEYHKVEIPKTSAASGTTVIITPNPTCNTLTNCTQCISANIGFSCQWCHKAKRCSDGTDRLYQEWRKLGCHKKLIEDESGCVPKRSHHYIGVGAIVAIIVLLSIVFLLVAWLLYAYRNPQSKSGIWLIEHRPSQLKAKLSQVRFWKRGDGGDKYQVTMQPDGESVA